MAHPWAFRAFTTDEAAELAGLKRATLDVWLGRYPQADIGEKRRTKRVFSPRDIATIRLALELERHGWGVAEALDTSLLIMLDAPEPDAVLVVAGRGTLTISDRDIPRLNLDQSKILIPVGRMAQEIIAATAA